MTVRLSIRNKSSKKLSAHKFKITPLAALLTGIIVVGSTTTYAQEAEAPAEPTPSEVDVNELLEAEPTSAGGKRSEDVQELVTIGVREVVEKKLATIHEQPFSQSIISGETLGRELGLDYEAMSKRLANVTFNQNNTRGASLSIRGVGKRAFAEVQDPSVLVIQDGVSFGLTALGNFDFYDIETVEAFRGPQGTLGGKGGSSGAVYVTTKRPTFEPEGELSVAYGERDSVIVKGAYGSAIIEDLLAWRGSFVVDKQRGYYENRFDENTSLYNKNRTSARVQLLLTPTEDLNALLSVDIEPRAAQLQNGLTFYHTQPERYADGSLTDPSGTTAKAKFDGFVNASGQHTPARGWFVGRSFGLNNVYTYDDYIANEEDETVYINEVRGQTVSNKGASLNIDYAFESHTFNSITAWRNYTFDARNDEGTPFDISVDGGGGVDFKQYSQEFSIESDKNETFDYIGGIIFFQTENNIVSKTGWGSDAGAWFATTGQYNTLERNAGVNRGAGKALLHDALASGRKRGDTWVETESNAIYGNADWHWHEAATLTVGLRVGSEDRTTTDQIVLENNGVGGAFNPVEVRGYNLGGFNTAQFDTSNTAEQKQLADSVAYEYYGVAASATPGAAYQSLTTAQKNQVAAAKSLRASQIGQLIPLIESNYDDTLYTGFLSQSYEFTETVRGYVSWQYGEKSGTAFNINGETANVKPETTNSYELGLKTFLFEDTLTLNANIFAMDIDDYQQAIRVVDEWQTQDNINNGIANPTAYTTAQGNVNKVRVEGLEFDGIYSGIENISIRFSGAYNDAYYKDFKNSPKPAELTYLTEPFVDQTGKNLPGASKWTVNLGVEYRVPVFSAAEFHTSFNTAYWSDYLNADDLSEYSYFPSGSRTDAAIGIGTLDGNLDVSLIVKNAFDDRTHEEGWTSYAPWPYPRWFGVAVTGKF
ncbi:MAG TPA: TonB-dependent receptor [Cellvibrio sp.]|nr:TonB-dependent receptor [Cellvibrio sp.]